MGKQRIRLAFLFPMIIALQGSAAAQSPPPGPCAQIMAACLHAGFTRNGANAGNGLQADCMAPIMQGATQPRAGGKPLPQVDPQLVAACKARNTKPEQANAPAAQAIAGTPIKIMPLGDSITYGTPNPAYGGYRHALGALLRNDGYNVHFVGSQHSETAPDQDNEGHPGWTVAQIRNGIDANRWLETSEPDIILLHIGTNDIRLRQAASAPASFSALLDDILARLPRTHVIVAQIIPFRAGPDKDHQSYNDTLPRIVASKGPRVSLVDMRTTVLSSDYADGLHPNAAGYDKMARAWEPAIRAVLSKVSNQNSAPPVAPRPPAATVTTAKPEAMARPPSVAAPAAMNVAGAAAEPARRDGSGSGTQGERPAAAEDQPQRVRKQISPRQPRGIYAVVLDRRRFPFDHRPYTATIDNPAISGLFLYFDWATLEPKEGQFDFSLLEEALNIADSRHKTIQLALIPGFSTPPWLLEELPSCDDWLASGGKTGSAPPQCGRATFGLPEGVARKGEVHDLPLPWNPAYKRQWHAFLLEFAKRFDQREAIVSIAIAGPTSQSEEIIMPHKGPGETDKWARLLEAFYRDPSYHRSNKAFVEEWKAEIDDYGSIFNNITLALTLAAGLPFNPTQPGRQEASTVEITTYFASKPLGSNAKAVQNNGVMAAHPLTMRPVKSMSTDTRFNPRVLAGGEFSTGFARDPALEGCPSGDKSSPACRSTTPEQALANVLAVFFAGTPYGHFYGSQDGAAPVYYLQIYQDDILYANDHPPVQAKLLETSKRILSSN